MIYSQPMSTHDSYIILTARHTGTRAADAEMRRRFKRRRIAMEVYRVAC